MWQQKEKCILSLVNATNVKPMQLPTATQWNSIVLCNASVVAHEKASHSFHRIFAFKGMPTATHYCSFVNVSWLYIGPTNPLRTVFYSQKGKNCSRIFWSHYMHPGLLQVVQPWCLICALCVEHKWVQTQTQNTKQFPKQKKKFHCNLLFAAVFHCCQKVSLILGMLNYTVNNLFWRIPSGWQTESKQSWIRIRRDSQHENNKKFCF